MMANGSEMVANARGYKIFRQWWLPEKQPYRAAVIVVHGMRVGFDGIEAGVVDRSGSAASSTWPALLPIDENSHEAH